jgi:hypothetical protein
LLLGEFDFAVSNCDDVYSLIRAMIIMLNENVEKSLNLVNRGSNIQDVAGNFKQNWDCLTIVPNFLYVLDRFPQKAEFILRLITFYPYLFNFNAFVGIEFESMLWRIIPTVLVPIIQIYMTLLPQKEKNTFLIKFINYMFINIESKIKEASHFTTPFRRFIFHILCFCLNSTSKSELVVKNFLDLIMKKYLDNNLNEVSEEAVRIDENIMKNYINI